MKFVPYIMAAGIALNVAYARADVTDIAKLVKENSGKNTVKTEKVTEYAIGIPAPAGYKSVILRFWEYNDPKIKPVFLIDLYNEGKVEVLQDKGADWTFETEFDGVGATEQDQRNDVYRNPTPKKHAPTAEDLAAATAIREQLEKFIASKK